MNRLQLRDWQKRCKEAFYEKLCASPETGKMSFKIEACVAAGKSTMMAELARELILGDWAEEFGFEFVAIVAPNLAITGAHTARQQESFGIIGALEQRGIWAMERITAEGRINASINPQPKQTDAGVTGVAAVFTYHYMRQDNVQRQLLDWAASGKKIAMFYDEIHHVPNLGSSWSDGLQRVNAGTHLAAYFSGTWYRTDRRAIFDQISEGVADPDFSYTYAEGIVDGIVRPVSFWIPNTLARTKDENGVIIDERPVDQYLEQVPLEIKEVMFDPNGWFVEGMIRRAADELARRRVKYPDAGCLVICPPGFHDDDDQSKEALADQDRKAEEIHRRVEQITGKKATLVLNGHPPDRIAKFRESDEEFIVAVNRISEGCDIPRLRIVLILRDLSGTKLQFNQIVGRVIRRRPQDDEEPALVIMPPIQGMCEFARSIAIAEKGAVPKSGEVCSNCGRLPCKCPCTRCGKPRPCKCPCFWCGERPCICPEDVPLDIFVELEGIHDQHITRGTDMLEPYTLRAGAIRERKEDCRHMDLANLSYILQVDAEINGSVSPLMQPAVQAAERRGIVATGAQWGKLRDTIPIKVQQLARLFREREKIAPQGNGKTNPYTLAWSHINRKFFAGRLWSQIKDNPEFLTVEKMNHVVRYIDEVTRSRMVRS